MPEKQDGHEGHSKSPTKKTDVKPTPRVWDLFQDGLPRGVPGADSDFDEQMNKPPWRP